MEKKLIFFCFLRPLHLICPEKKVADFEFYFYFFFVLRLSHLAEKICKTKNKKTLALSAYDTGRQTSGNLKTIEI